MVGNIFSISCQSEPGILIVEVALWPNILSHLTAPGGLDADLQMAVFCDFRTKARWRDTGCSSTRSGRCETGILRKEEQHSSPGSDIVGRGSPWAYSLP